MSQRADSYIEVMNNGRYVDIVLLPDKVRVAVIAGSPYATTRENNCLLEDISKAFEKYIDTMYKRLTSNM